MDGDPARRHVFGSESERHLGRQVIASGARFVNVVGSQATADSLQHADDDLGQLPPQLEPVRRLLLQINDLGFELTKAIIDAGFGEASSNGAVAVLSKLAIDGPARPKELLRSVRLSPGGLSNLLERLESSNLITRTYGQVPGDRRGAIIVATDAGAAAAAGIADAVARSLDSGRAAIFELTQTLAEIEPHRPGPKRSAAKRPTDMERLVLVGQIGLTLEEAFAGDDPTPGKTAIVLCSAAQPERTRPRELMERLALSSGGVTQLIDRLETAGLIYRTTGQPPDHRAVIIALTPHGRRHLEHLLTVLTRRLDTIESALDGLAA